MFKHTYIIIIIVIIIIIKVVIVRIHTVEMRLDFDKRLDSEVAGSNRKYKVYFYYNIKSINNQQQQ